GDDILRRAAPVLAGLVAEGFKDSRKPTGGRWRKLKHPRGAGHPNRGGPLYDRGLLKVLASRVWVGPRRLTILVAHPGATTQQYGRGRVPARPFLPTGKAL